MWATPSLTCKVNAANVVGLGNATVCVVISGIWFSGTWFIQHPRHSAPGLSSIHGIQHLVYPASTAFSTWFIQHPGHPAPGLSSIQDIQHLVYPASTAFSTWFIQHPLHSAPGLSSIHCIQHPVYPASTAFSTWFIQHLSCWINQVLSRLVNTTANFFHV